MTIEYNEKFNFNHITAEDGMVITDYTEDKDIKEYSSSKEMYAPVTLDLSGYYEITDEEDAEYKVLQDIAIREEMERKKEEVEDKKEEKKDKE